MSKAESHRMTFLDFSKPPKQVNLEMKEYEIWIGNHHLGQGSHSSNKPQMVDKVKATSFKIACVIHEHRSAINSLELQMNRGDTYIEDCHFGSWYYNPKTNSNSWTGKYFETEDEAWESFEIKTL